MSVESDDRDEFAWYLYTTSRRITRQPCATCWMALSREVRAEFHEYALMILGRTLAQQGTFELNALDETGSGVQQLTR